MIIKDKSGIPPVGGITDEQRQAIHHFLQGTVYCWCKNRPDEWFRLASLMGGDNFYWEGTPLQELYKKHMHALNDSDAAIAEAGKDAGALLKAVISNDPREFETRKENGPREYKWVKDDE